MFKCVQELEARLVEKDEIINDTKKKSQLLEKHTAEAEKQARELKHKNEDLQRQVRVEVFLSNRWTVLIEN